MTANFTEKAIKDTFITLLREKPLNEITIKELTERCGINRNTFYYHFRDIPALVEDIMNEEVDGILADHPDLASIEDCLFAILDFVKENQQIILHVYRSLSRTVFEKYLWKLCRRLVENYWHDTVNQSPLQLNKKEQKIVANFYTCTCFGLAMDWLNSGMLSDSAAREDLHHLFEIIERGEKLGILVRVYKN